MTLGDQYRVRAVEFEAKAKCAPDSEMQAEFENLARSYRRLAEQADRNARTDIVYETPPPALPKADADGTC
jgi:hypothetical protein